ncbi:MAG: EamA family transporter [Rhodospirillales bacterium]|jgi:O-acetylserine/cysteine efflux transporter|nr:EamA family transporter [Rhodospirillales bacterium]
MRPLDAAAAAAVIVIWGSNFVIAKIGLAQFPPLLMMALRFAVAAVVLAPFLKPLGRPLSEIAIVSVTMGTVHFGLMFTGLSGIGAGTAALTAQLFVPFSVILARVVFGERMNPSQVAGMVLAFAGVAILGGAGGGETSLLHLLIVVAGAFMFALGNIQVKRLGPVNPFVLNAWITVLAAPQLFVVSLVLEDGHWAALASADRWGWGAVLFLGLVATVVALALWYRLLVRYPVNRVVPLSLLGPVLAVFIAAAVLDEPLGPRTLGGGLITIVGVALVQLRGSRSTAAKVQAP